MAEHHLTAQEAQERLRGIGSPEVAAVSARFFKTGPGEYGEGDMFIGVRVPVIRKVAKEFKTLPPSEVEIILHSEIHEERLLALVIMVSQYEKGDSRTRKQIYDLYLANTEHINNWDLVDLSAPHIVGGYLEIRSRRPLYRLAKSSCLWERRIAILATFRFIRQDDLDDTLKIAGMLLEDKEDLIHKAVGWMLREVGKRDLAVEEDFLADHAGEMPRTMLRYAIEKLPEPKRQMYLGADAIQTAVIIMGEGKRPIQFNLRTLLLIVSATAIALGAARWLGEAILPFVVAAVGIWFSAKTKGRHLLVWLVPSLWSICAFGSWHHPGDEYGVFIVSVLASIWLAFLLDFGHLSEVYLLLIAAGALPMAGFGFILDRLPVSRRLWSAFYIVASVGWFAWMLWQFPTLEKAIAKNGSISAYAFCAANLGLYASVLLFLVGGTIRWLWRCFFRRQRQQDNQ